MKTARALTLVLSLALLLPLAGAIAAFQSPVVLVAVGTTAGAPRGVHLSITEDAQTTMTVTWFTNGSADPGPAVQFGLAPDALDTTVGAHASTPLPGVDGLAHEATMRGLEPGTRYHYRVGGSSGWSPTFSFRTDDGDDKFRVVVIGDHGTKETSLSTLQHLLAAQPDLWLIAGDLSYANGKQQVWDVWFDQIEPLAASVPLMAAIGNHEQEEEGVWGTQAWETRLSLPGRELFYGFDYGNVHFYMHDSDHSYLTAQRMLVDAVQSMEAHLRDAAARRDAGELDHVIVVQHHPLWADGTSSSRQAGTALIATEEPMLHAYGVKLLVTAHNHNYQRSKPMIAAQPTESGEKDYVDPVGFVHLVTGGGGQSLYSFRDPNDHWLSTATYAMRYHYTLLDVDGGKLSARAIDTWFEPGKVFDRFSITVTT